MLMNGRERGEFERVGDLLKARRIAVFIEEPDQVIQDFFLPLGQRHRTPLGWYFLSLA